MPNKPVLFLARTATVAAPSGFNTLSLQPPSIDTHIRQDSPDTNYGSLDELYIRESSTTESRALIKFDFSSLPPGVSIADAILYLYNYSASSSKGRFYYCYRLTQPAWTELGCTWNKYDGINNWITPGGDFTIDDSDFSHVAVDDSWQHWHVKAQVQYARDNLSDIVHFLLRDPGPGTSYTRYRSKNYSVDLTLRPKLYILYCS